MKNEDWFQKRFKTRTLNPNKLTQVDFSAFMKAVHVSAKMNDFKSIDELIEDLMVENISKYTITCVLRSTFPFKDKLTKWEEFKNFSINTLVKEGKNPHDVLQGLI